MIPACKHHRTPQNKVAEIILFVSMIGQLPCSYLYILSNFSKILHILVIVLFFILLLLEINLDISQNNRKLELLYHQTSPLLYKYTENFISYHGDICIPRYIAALFFVAKNWNLCSYPLADKYIMNIYDGEYSYM